MNLFLVVAVILHSLSQVVRKISILTDYSREGGVDGAKNIISLFSRIVSEIDATRADFSVSPTITLDIHQHQNRNNMASQTLRQRAW